MPPLKPSGRLWHDGLQHAKIAAMPEPTPSHPDRLAATLAQLPAAHGARAATEVATAGAGAADCRIDLKLALWRALAAAERAPAAAAHLERFPEARHPDLWAGTVRDGAALGWLAHLAEVEAIATAATGDDANVSATAPPVSDDPTQTGTVLLDERALRRKKDILVASAGPRIRFTRKGGLLLVDRDHGVHSANCLWFEARRDHGTLDGFVGDEHERPRLFSAQFLKPRSYSTGPDRSELVLAGRLGRGRDSWPLTITLRADSTAPTLELVVDLAGCARGWRLRSRVLGVPAGLLHHHCRPVREFVDTVHGGFVADTLVRAVDTLLVDGQPVATPDAARPRDLRHVFTIGAR